MARRKTGLGRGLSALIPEGESAIPENRISQIPVEAISPNPRQPRGVFDPGELSELATSIREHGVIQPLILTRGDSPNAYTLIAGERRWQAAKEAGLKFVPAVIREASDQELLELALIENIQRTDLNPLEAAEAYRQLAEDFQLSHEEIALRVGKSRVAITNTLRLLKLPPDVKQAVVDKRITEGHARALLSLATPQGQVSTLQTIEKKHLSVRQTEELVRKMGGHQTPPSPNPTASPEIKALEERLRIHLGTRVSLNHKKQGGTLVIHYYSEEELNALVEQILGEI